ncbi:MBL fold metallo-hydrolase [Roseivirga sp. BDSF3-8]|uniref:MBL fold metallo-hydrolase n=1 Tax=Roseivirga sp. BDSF3-8 TaxID=3241598 RepID=UPI0035326863
MSTHISNPDLLTIKDNWPGTPLDEKGRFVNHEHPFEPKFSDLIKWVTGPKPQKKAKKEDDFSPETDDSGAFLEGDEDCIVWLGHASFYIRLSGITFLTDPVFYNIPFTRRISHIPIAPEKLRGIDYLLISHDHRDHCQKQSLQLLAKNNPKMKVMAGLEMEMVLEEYTGGLPVQTAGWYQQFRMAHEEVELFFLPSRHWGRRHLTDTNKRLWGAFVFRHKGKTIYFSGDTGYGSHLKEVKELFEEGVDVCIIGIGAFRPEWFMSPNHISPSDAVKASNEMGARYFIPMHYGTFDLSNEPSGEPIGIARRLADEGRLKGTLCEPVLGRPVDKIF